MVSLEFASIIFFLVAIVAGYVGFTIGRWYEVKQFKRKLDRELEESKK
jgi:membrane protein DedA with SNARE-associated domain